jgi:hypothetical protein
MLSYFGSGTKKFIIVFFCLNFNFLFESVAFLSLELVEVNSDYFDCLVLWPISVFWCLYMRGRN